MDRLTEPSEYLTGPELASLLRTSPETVRYWVHIGKAPRSIKIGRKRLWKRSDVDAWLDAAAVEQNGAA